jgi:hypothetical protein
MVERMRGDGGLIMGIPHSRAGNQRLGGGEDSKYLGGVVARGRVVFHREALHAQLPSAAPGIRDRQRGSGRN